MPVFSKNVHTGFFLPSKETSGSISDPEILLLVRTGLNASCKCSTGIEMVFLIIWRHQSLHFLLFSSYLWFMQLASTVLDLFILWAILEVKLLSIIISLLTAASGAKWKGRNHHLRLCIGVSWLHLLSLVPSLHVIQPMQHTVFNLGRITWSEITVVGEILKPCSPLKNFIWTKISSQAWKSVLQHVLRCK